MIIIKIKKNILIKILNIINFITEKKKINLVLSNFFLLKSKNKISFIANNDVIYVKISIFSKSKKNILIGISIKKIFNIIKNFPDCILTLSFSKKKKIVIKSEDIKYKLNTTLTTNYLNLRIKEKYKSKLYISKKKLSILIKLIHFILKNEENDNSINGVLFDISNNKIKISATDNYRIIFYEIKIKDIKYKKKLVIPIKTIFLLKLLLKLNTNNRKKFKINIDKNEINFKIKNILINSKLINLEFPALKEKIKNIYKNSFLIERKKLELILKRSLSIIESKLKFTTWKIRKNLLKVITSNENEKGEENIIITYNGENIDININTLHLLDIINNIKVNEFQFNFSKNKKTIIIKALEYKKFKYIITSLKI